MIDVTGCLNRVFELAKAGGIWAIVDPTRPRGGVRVTANWGDWDAIIRRLYPCALRSQDDQGEEEAERDG
jgi:hypothetical protein